jgi:outer membrane biosynthesis protein TonB
MAEMRFGDREERDLDWESLDGPVPMDLIDSDFPAHAPQAMPGAASEILPREESEALAREAGAELPSDTHSDTPSHPASDASAADDISALAAHPVSASTSSSSATETPFHPSAYGQDSAAVDPRATIAGGTWFAGNQAQQDDFARIRAEMEAEDEAEKQRKGEAEREEAAQRARLEQWMANARARLMKADADLTGPAGRIRLRKDTSPSLYRLAEMQKTMDLSGEPTVPDGTFSLLAPTVADPMATISVPADQFLKLDPATTSGPAAGFPPLRPFPADNPATRSQLADSRSAHPSASPGYPDIQSDATPADPTQTAIPVHPFVRPAPSSYHPATGKFPVQPVPAASLSNPAPAVPDPQASPSREEEGAPAASFERSLAYPPESEAAASQAATAFRPMTREEALTRKVAKLRMAAETGENTLVRSPLLDEESDGRAVNFAIAAMVLVAILVLGLGLFAATQAGLFDGMENRIPFLKPKVAMQGLSPSAGHPGAVPAQTPVAPLASGPASASEVARTPAAPAASATPVASATSAESPSPAASAAPVAPAATAPEARLARAPAPGKSAPAGPSAPARAAEASPRYSPVTARAARAQARPVPTAPAVGAKTAAKARKSQAQSFPPAPPEEEIPAYARPRASGAAQAEIQLRNAVESAANQEKEDLRELYNRYALGFPGLSGEVVIGLTVDPSGRILEATVVSSTTGVTTFDQDLVRKVVLWRLRSFPESRPKFISVPFLFPMQGH